LLIVAFDANSQKQWLRLIRPLDVSRLVASTWSTSALDASKSPTQRVETLALLLHSTTHRALESESEGVESRCARRPCSRRVDVRVDVLDATLVSDSLRRSTPPDSCIRPLPLVSASRLVATRRVKTRAFDHYDSPTRRRACRFYVVEDSTRRVTCIRPLQLYDSLSTSVETARRVDVVNVRGRPVGFSPPTRLAVCRGVAVYRGVPRRESIADSTSSRVARALGIVEPSRGRESPSSSAPGPPRSNSPPPRWHRL